MNIRKITLLTSLLTLLALLAPAAATAGDAPAKKKLKLCIYDPSGAVGDAYNMAKDYRAAAAAWGAELELSPYTDERTASEDFKAGKCDLALLTGVRSRHFNRFAGTVEALGALKSYDQLHSVLKLLASPKAGKKMQSGNYEVIAIFPAGAVYLMLRDRNLRNVKDLAGKRIATLDFDEAAISLVDRAGASMVPADVGTFAGMFNNGGVDVAYAPAAAVEPLELKKGLLPDGGMARYPLAQLTLQILAHHDRIDEAFGNASRKWAADNFRTTLKVVERAEKAIPAKLWIEISPEEEAMYDDLFRNVRLDMREKDVFDGTMLRLMRRVRCQANPKRAECAEKRE
ncbi:MAG: DUF6091 family protein [Deltaproteobacteria bacterium]|nr:DUF6091 family protein [Deltaproteobacteria bacterium]